MMPDVLRVTGWDRLANQIPRDAALMRECLADMPSRRSDCCRWRRSAWRRSVRSRRSRRLCHREQVGHSVGQRHRSIDQTLDGRHEVLEASEDLDDDAAGGRSCRFASPRILGSHPSSDRERRFLVTSHIFTTCCGRSMDGTQSAMGRANLCSGRDPDHPDPAGLDMGIWVLLHLGARRRWDPDLDVMPRDQD